MKNEDYGSLNLDEEFFPLNEDIDSIDGKDKNKPVTFKSYTKNLLSTTSAALKGVSKVLLPETSEIISQIGIAKDTAVDAARIKIDKVREQLQRKSTGKSMKETVSSFVKEIGNDVKKAIKTGDFTFGANDQSLSFGDEFDFEDNDLNDGIVNLEKSDNIKIYKSEESNLSNLSNQLKDNAEKSSSIAISLEKASETQNMKLYVASENSEKARHIQSVGYISNIDSNVEKIAKYFATIGIQSVSAQMEYSQKQLALQEDVVKLLNIIKEQTFTPRNDSKESYSGGLLSSIFGSGFNGSEWSNTILKNFSEAFEYSPIGSMISGLGTARSMGMGSKGSMIGSLFSMIPGLFLNTESRVKLENFDSLIKTLPGIANAKLNQMAMTSDNPFFRMLGSFLGVKELSTKKVDLGIKDLGAKANFDQKFYHTVTDAIPGLLSKILAVQSGQGEIYYDFKAGTFKSGEQAVRQYEYEKSKVYQSSIKYNEIIDKMSGQTNEFIKETEPDLSDEEREEKSKIMRKDFSTISQNIASVNSLFDPKTSLDNENYQKLINQGTINPNNLLYFIKIFKKLHKNDKTMFARGSEETKQNIGDFYKRTVPEMIKSGAGGSFVADALIEEKVKEAKELLSYQDIGKKFNVNNPIQSLAKLKYLKGQEEIKMKYGGIVGSVKSVDVTDIGKIAEKGVNTQLGVLNNIYELLLGGIIVYPNENTPIEIIEKIKSYNETKDYSIKEKELLENQKQIEDEELRKARREQAILSYKTSHSLKSLPEQVVEKKFGVSKTKKVLNDRLQNLLEKLSNSVFTGIYGKNEETNEGKLSYEEEIARSIDKGSIKIAESLSKILKKSKPSNTTITREAIKNINFDEEFKISENASNPDKITNFIKKEWEKILQDLYGGNIDIEEIDKMIKGSILGKSKTKNKKEITKLPIPNKENKSVNMSFNETAPENVIVKTKGENEDFDKTKSINKITINLDDTNKHLLSIDKTTKNILDFISQKEKTIIYKPNKKSDFIIDNSKDIVNSIDSFHTTSKEFYEKILKSGMFDSFKRIDSNMLGLKDHVSEFNVNLKGMSGDFEIMIGKLLSGIDFPGIPPEMIEQIKKKNKDLGTKAKRLSSKAITNVSKYKSSIKSKISDKNVSKTGGLLKKMIPSLNKKSDKKDKDTNNTSGIMEKMISLFDRGVGGIMGMSLGILGSVTGLGIKGLTKIIPGLTKLGGGTVSKIAFFTLKEGVKLTGGMLSILAEGVGKGLLGITKNVGKTVLKTTDGLVKKVIPGLNKKSDNDKVKTNKVKNKTNKVKTGKETAKDGGLLEKIFSKFDKKDSDKKSVGVKGLINKSITKSKNFVKKLLNVENDNITDETNINGETYDTNNVINKILNEVTLIRTGLDKFYKSDKSVKTDKKSIKPKSIKEKIKDSKDSLTNYIKNAFSSINIFKKKEDVKTSNVNREGGYLDQQKDARDKLMLDAEISMDKNITEIRDMLYSFFNEDKKSKKKKKKSESEKGEKESLFQKVGGWGTVGLAAGAALLGTGLYQSTRGKSKLNKSSGLDKYGPTGDKFLSNAGLESSSKYGFDGKELSFGERSAQSSSIAHAPQALMTANALHKVGKAINKKVTKLGVSGTQKIAETATKIAPKSKTLGLVAKITKDIPGSIIGLFDKIFSNKFIKKIASTKMISGIKSGLTKILKPQLFKGVASEIGQKLMMLAGPVGVAMSVNDFITGMDSAPRYFNLGKGAKPNITMRIISGVVNVLSGFLFGLIPADFIVTTLYNIMGSEEERNYISEFKKFTEEKAKILEVPPGPLGEFETKNFWQRMFGSGKKDAGILNFGTDEKGFDKFKTWRDEKYKPVEELREKISKEYGGDNVTGKIPSSPDEKENQSSYRETFLSSASDLVKSINEIMKSKEDKEKTIPNKEEKQKTIFDSSKETKLPSADTKTTATTASIVGGKSLLNINNKSKESPDLTIPESVESVPNSIKSGIKESDTINSSLGMPTTESVSTSSEAMTTVSAAAIGSGMSVKPPIKKQEPQKINKDDYKLSQGDEKQGIGSPVVDDMQNITKNINTELDALLAVHTEQVRHNNISEEFYENAIKLISMLVETGKASFDLDKSRNEILAKSFLIDVDPKYKRYIRQNTDTVDMRTDSTGKVGGEGFFSSMFGGGRKPTQTNQQKTYSPSQIALGGSGTNYSQSNNTNQGYDKGEKSFSNKEIDMTSFDSNSYSFDDNINNLNENDNNLSSIIENYKKDNPTDMRVIQNVGSSKEVSNYIQNSIFGRDSTHELYQSNIPLIYNGKKIGLKSIYVPKADKNGMRSGDVIEEIKFINGDKQYLVDNTGESTMSLNIDFSKGKFNKGTKIPVLNLNVNVANQDKISTQTSKMVEFISNGGK